MKHTILLLMCLCLSAPVWAQTPVRVTNSGGVDYTQDATLTISTTTGPLGVCRSSNTEPTNVGADDRAVLIWCHRSGAQMMIPRDSDGDDATDPANNSIKVSLVSGTITTSPTTANTTESALTYYLTSAASNNATSVKASAGNVYKISAINTTSTLYYLRLYNLAAAPTCNSATGFIRSIPIPHNSGAGAGVVELSPYGTGYTTGIGFCLTGGSANNDNTNAATGVLVTIEYR